MKTLLALTIGYAIAIVTIPNVFPDFQINDIECKQGDLRTECVSQQFGN